MFLGAGTVLWMNQIQPYGAALQLIGFAVLIYMLFGWFGNVISESESGLYNKQVDASYRCMQGCFQCHGLLTWTMLFCGKVTRRNGQPWDRTSSKILR